MIPTFDSATVIATDFVSVIAATVIAATATATDTETGTAETECQ